VKTGTPAPAPSPVAVPAAALASPPPAARAAAAPVPTNEVEEPASRTVVTLDNRDDRDAPPVEDFNAEARYRQGYRWAERNGIGDYRDCYLGPGDPFTAGCLAWLRDADGAHDQAYSGDDRRYGWDR
jgi:hypothetical protein